MISTLPLENIRRNSSSRKKATPRTIKTKGKNTPRAETFKNPILGIEVNLRKQIQDIEIKYHATSYHKRGILLDALEDLAETNQGFKDIILDQVRVYRPPKVVRSENDRTFNLTNLIRSQNDYKDVLNGHSHAEIYVRDLEMQIKDSDDKVNEYNQKIKKLGEKLKNESDHFATNRKLNREMAILQQNFNDIFSYAEKPKEHPEIQGLIDDNIMLKKKFSKLTYELKITQDISRMMKRFEESLMKRKNDLM